jgi:IclR family mhp operon transcriptional activator
VTASSTSLPSIRSIARALEILRLINERQGLGLQDIHALSGLPKPTVYRILQTLRREGYLEAEAIPGVFRITAKALELSSGFTEESMIVKVAAPIALATTRKVIQWPLAIGILKSGTIVVRYSTMPYSKLGVVNTTIGHRHDLLESAMGRAYLMACDAAERQQLTQLLKSNSPEPASDIQRRVDAIVADSGLGYGLRLASSKRDSATLAIAVRHGSDLLAILSLTTFGTAMTPAFIANMLPLMRDTVTSIEAAYATALRDGASATASRLLPMTT